MQKKLENALAQVLSGYLTICATCKSIQDGSTWLPVEQYLIGDSDGVKFTHGYCPDCYQLAVGELG